MTENRDSQLPWGEYKPRGRDQVLRLITRLGLARGSIKGLVGGLYKARETKRPIDLVYQGIKLRLHPWDNSAENYILCGSRQRDREELEVLRRALKMQGTFVDIGANAGYYSLMAADFGAGRILALEPNPTMFSRLRFNVEINGFGGRITALQLGVGPLAGDMELFIHPDDLGGSSLRSPASSHDSITVPVQPLRNILLEAGLNHIDAMKIDVEGLETDILLPFFANAEKNCWPKVLIMEHEYAPATDDLSARLQQAGYRIITRTRANIVLRLAL
jgi:FkbM family methyltransferase